MLRRASGVTATTFHRPDPMTGAAFMGSLVQGAMARVDVRIATSKTVELAVTQILGGTLTVMPWGSHPAVPHPPASGIAIVARGRDRAGLRFAVAVARLIPRELRGPVTLMGPREAPWRIRTAVPKALREDIRIIPDTGPESWRQLLAPAAIVLLGTPGDVDGPVAAQAMADGRVVVAPRSPEADGRLEHGRDAVVLAPFVREPWAEAVRALLTDADRRTSIGHQAVAVSTSWDEIAEALEGAYLAALGRHQRGAAPSEVRVVADLRIRPATGTDTGPARGLLLGCRARRRGDREPRGGRGRRCRRRGRAARADGDPWPGGRGADGTLVGLFLSHDVPAGRGFAETADLIHAQGGVVLSAPATAATPPASCCVRRRHGWIAWTLQPGGGAGPASGPARRASSV